MRRDRAVVDDPAAARRLVAHHAERGVGAQEHRVEIDRDHAPPHLVGEVAEIRGGRAAAGIVEQHVDAAEIRFDLREQVVHLGRIGHVGLHHQGMSAGLHASGLLQHLLAPPGQRHRPAVAHQCQRRCAPDAAARAGDDGKTVCHGVSPLGWCSRRIVDRGCGVGKMVRALSGVREGPTCRALPQSGWTTVISTT